MPAGYWRPLWLSAMVMIVVTASASTIMSVAPGDVTPVALAADAPQTASIRIDPGAASSGYSTPNVTMAAGGTLTVVNFDSIRHSVTAEDHDTSGNPLFSVIAEPGTTTTITAASSLVAGTYAFYCIFHSAFMRGTLTISGSGGSVVPTPVSFDQPLVVPKVLNSSPIRIPVKKTSVRVLPSGPMTPMWTYDGTYPGPTITRSAGQLTKVRFVNELPKTSWLTTHFHGDHHGWRNDGQPARFLIKRGAARTYTLPLTDHGHPERASFFWYHDHRMGVTARNNWRGLQGMFIIRDGWANKLGLPGGKYDVPLMVSERSFNALNGLSNPFRNNSMVTSGPAAPPNDGTVGDHILVNGRYAPYLDVDTHRYRLRLLNSSPFTSYDFALSDGHPFIQIGTGNGLLPNAVVRQDILLGPGQRADVVVDFRGEYGSNVVLESIPRSNPPKNAVGSPSVQIMQFRVDTQVGDTSRVPAALEPAPKINVPSKVSAVWNAGLASNSTGSFWTFDGKPYAARRVVLKVPRGSTQMWLLRNPTRVTHYIHLHEEEWRTILRDGKAPPPWERGLEDTWRLDPGESVQVAARFTDYDGVFMIHCHMLDHEDHGLMAQFAVVDPKTRALPPGYYYDGARGPAALASRITYTQTATQGSLIRQILTAPDSPVTAAADLMCEPPRKAGEARRTASGRKGSTHPFIRSG